MMAKKSIIFNTEMVRAILKGTKTQTRRPVKPQPEGQPMYCYAGSDNKDIGKWLHGGKRYTPPCHGGDILWVRETFIYEPATYCWDASINIPAEPARYIYAADYRDPLPGEWRRSVHMPREAARLFLEVKDVRVERLQEISEEDAIKEGCGARMNSKTSYTARQDFMHLWQQLYDYDNKKKKCHWLSNPFCWVISFERRMAESARVEVKSA